MKKTLDLKINILKRSEGFGLVEAILAASLFFLVIAVFAGALILSQQSVFASGNASRAAFVAEEGLEAARNIRDEDFANLEDGTHGLAIDNGKWKFSGSSENVDMFTREIEISAVDANTKQIISRVSWDGMFKEPHESDLETYLTNRQNPTP